MIAVYQRDPNTFIVADSPDAPVGALLRGTYMGPVVPIKSLLKWGYWTPVEPELQAAGWDESKHPRDPGGEGGGRWVRAGDLGSDAGEDFQPEAREEGELTDTAIQFQQFWRKQHESIAFDAPELESLSDANKAKEHVQNMIAEALEGDEDFLSLQTAIFPGGQGGTMEDWQSEFEPGGQFPTADTTEKKIAAMAVSAWARSSSDTDPISLQLQRAAAKEFGLQGFTAFHENTLAEMTELYRGSTSSPIWTDQQERGAMKFLRAQYDATQRMFEEAGIKQVDLYRGMGWKPSEVPDTIVPGTQSITRIRTNPMSSWSGNVDTAGGFTSGGEIKAIAASRVDVKRILSTPFTGAGCLNEYECIVLGGDDTDVFVASWNDKYLNDKDEIVEPTYIPVENNSINFGEAINGLWAKAAKGTR